MWHLSEGGGRLAECDTSRRRFLQTAAGVGIASVPSLTGVGTASSSGDERWRFETGDGIWSSPTVVDGTVFVGSNDGNVYALDAGSGDERWQFATEGDAWGSPTVVDGTVFVGSEDHNVYALEAASGDERWRFATEEGIGPSSPTVVDGTVYVASLRATNVYALDAASGDERWRFETGAGIRSGLTVVDGTVFVGASDANLYALDAGSGDERWRFATGAEVVSSATVADGTVYVGSEDHNVYALEAASGDDRWRFETGAGIWSSPTVADGTVFIGGRDGNVYALEAASGDGRWRFDTVEGVSWSSPTVVDGTVYVGSEDHNVYALDAGVDGSSHGSRVMHGTFGHHSEWHHAGQTIVDDTSPAADDDGDEIGTQELVVLGGLLTLLGVYVLKQRTGDEDEPARPDTGDTTDATTNTATPTSPDATATDDSPTPTDVIDEHLDDVRTRLDSARRAADDHAYDRALDACQQAIDVAEDTRETALEDAPGSVADVDEALADARRLRTDIETERNAYQHATIELDRIPDELGATESIDAEQPDEALARIDDLGETLAETAARVDEHGFDDLRERVETLETRHTRLQERYRTRTEAHDQVTSALTRVDDALATAEAALDDGTPQKAVNALNGISATLDDARETIDEHDFSALAEQLDAHARRLERLREDTTEAVATVPSSIPTAPRLSLSYDDIQKGKTLGWGGNADVFYATTTTDEDVELALKEPRTGAISHADTVKEMLTEAPTWDQDETDYLVTVLDTQLDITERVIQAAETWRRFDDQNTLVAVVATHHTDTVEQLERNAETILTHDDVDTIDTVVDTVQSRSVEPLMNEAETWQKLDDHDHIVSVIDYGSDPLPWIAMEYMDGGHLGHRAGEMDLDQAVWTALATTEGVRHAHDRGVAHFDLKPQNVLLRRVEGAWDVPKVADWGLSRHLLDHSSSVAGMSPSYAAPEQLDTDVFGRTDNVTDIYQLGAVFYELFTGWPPFEGRMLEVIQQIQTEEPTPPSDRADLPPELDDILLTALATDKDDRYEHVLYLRDELQALWEEYSSSATTNRR